MTTVVDCSSECCRIHSSHVTDLEEVDALVEMSLIIVCQFESMVTRSALVGR
jgi:hypothetical protein